MNFAMSRVASASLAAAASMLFAACRASDQLGPTSDQIRRDASRTAAALGSPAAPAHFFSFTSGANADIGGATGTLFGNASVTNGKLALDGSGDYEDLNTGLIPSTGSFSVTLFVREILASGQYVEFIAQGLTSGNSFYIGHSPADVIRVSDAWPGTGVTMPGDHLEHHFAVTYDAVANLTALYIDGQLQATHTGIKVGPGAFTRFGRQFGNYSEYLNGELDEIGVFNTVLSAADVLAYATRAGDVDGDGVIDSSDNCRFVVNASQTDFDQDGTGDACDSTPGADLALAFAVSPPKFFLNQQATVQLKVSDAGPGASSGSTVFVPASPGFRFVSASGAACGPVVGGLQCSVGPAAVGGQAAFSVTVKPVQLGEFPITLTLTGNETDTNTSNNVISRSVRVN